MPFEIQKLTTKEIPKVGDCWRHDSGEAIFLRVADEVGEKVLNDGNPRPTHFYSVNVGDGRIYSSNRENGEVFVIFKKVVCFERP